MDPAVIPGPWDWLDMTALACNVWELQLADLSLRCWMAAGTMLVLNKRNRL